jgi:uncharacterized damage-inducible protein DinB
MNPYAASLGERDALATLAETPDRIRMLVSTIGPAGLSRSHAPGKWNVRQLLVHLAQVEMAFGVRARMALTTDNYLVQPFEQDAWMEDEARLLEADVALAAYEGMRAMNLALFRSLTPEQRRRPLTHPERGPMQVEDIFTTLAGHELHHLAQIASVAAHS